MTTSGAVKTVPAGRSRAVTRLFRATSRIGSSLGAGRLTPSPRACSPSPDGRDEVAELIRRQRRLVVRARQRAVGGEVLLDVGGTSGDRGDRDRETRRMVGQPHGNAKGTGIRVHDAKVGQRRIGGIVADA